MQQPDRSATTIAILGANTVVGSALSALLEASGYRIAPIDSHPTGIVDELLEGADLLLLAPRLDGVVREAFVRAMGKRSPETAGMPVIALRTAQEEAPPEEGMIGVPWPCETKILVERIEAALLVPPGYDLDRSETDVLVLRGPDGTAIATFSARGATAEAIAREARAHHRGRNLSAWGAVG